ncbi:uncharacterized protein TNCV_207871 [Trichonephila clavipes]|nr:uncharacterized protein TNCV_207871 [Trichonephila clavipes]
MIAKELHQLKYEAISVPQGSIRLVKKTQERKSSTCYLLITKGVTSSSPVSLKTRRDIDKVLLPSDKASSRTSKSKAAYSTNKESETEIRCIPFGEIPVKSPDASPMDFSAFCLLKRALGKEHPKTLNGLWKMVQDEWNKICMAVLIKSLLS